MSGLGDGGAGLPWPPFSCNDEQLLALARAHGRETVSFQALEPSLRTFWHRAGAVAYTDTGRAWVTAGAPLCRREDVPALAGAFVAAARAGRRRAVFCAVEDPAAFGGGFASFRIGHQPVWDPRGWTAVVRGSRSLREQLRRARAKKVRVRCMSTEALGADRGTEAAVHALARRWLAHRHAPPLRFLLSIELSHHASERLLFLAERDGVLVGVLSVVPVYVPSGAGQGADASGGVFLQDVLRDRSAPNGTAELLIDAAMRHAADQGRAHATMGLVPLSGKVPGWLAPARRLPGPFYRFEGLQRFRQKLGPRTWEPVFIVHPEGVSAPGALWDTLSAVTGGSPLRWGLAALREQRRVRRSA